MFWFIINFTLCLVFVKVWPKEDLFFEITQITLKTMYPPSHHQNGFVPTQALEHRFFIVYKNLFYCMCLSIISIIYVQFYYQVLLYTFICIFNRLFFVTWSLHDSEVRKFEILLVIIETNGTTKNCLKSLMGNKYMQKWSFIT